MSRHLFIISRQQPELYSYLTREFSGEPDVRVILDRRQGDRRRQCEILMTEGTDRRHAERRGDSEMGDQLSSLGYAFVRLS